MTINCTFKHVLTGISFDITIESTMQINKLKKYISTKVNSIMNINDNNYEIIIAGQSNREMGLPIDLNSNDVFGSLKSKSFYIRPNDYFRLNENNLTCCICEQHFNIVNFNPWTSCAHYRVCCESCMSNWTKKRIMNKQKPNCPMCRNIICIR